MAEDIFGKIETPNAISVYDSQASNGIGLILFFSNILNLFSIIMGLVIFFNFISAGYIYITSSGDNSAHTKVREKLTFSVVGLVIIVMAYSIAGIIGLVFFNDATFILNPEIIGPSNPRNPLLP